MSLWQHSDTLADDKGHGVPKKRPPTKCLRCGKINPPDQGYTCIVCGSVEKRPDA